MKTLFVMASITVQPLVFIGEVNAELTLAEFNQGEGNLTADFEVTSRYEYWNWFTPSAQNNDNNDYGYPFTRTRIGLCLALPQVRAYVQAQDTRMWGLPDDAISISPAGPLGIGAVYFLHGQNQDYHSTVIRQAYLEVPRLFIDGLSTRAGRFDYVDGLEVIYKDPKVNWLKEIRLAERLIGPFAWSSFCRSFDGLQVAYDQSSFNLNSTLIHPTQGGFENNTHKTIYDIDLFTVTGTFKYDRWLPHTEGRLFYFYYNDDRDIAKVDNTPEESSLNEGDIQIHTVGMHWLGTARMGTGIFDVLFWGTFQTGDWGTLDHHAWATAIEAGYQFTQIPWKPWIRAGYFASSGDSNPTDGDHETFFQLLPTARKYDLFPFYNMMNNEDLFLQAILKPAKKMVIRTDLHALRLHEENDRWYMGAGPTREEGSIFGYIGRPSSGDDDLALVVEVTGIYNFCRYLSATLYYGHAFGRDVIRNVYAEDEDGDYFFLELTLKL
ncbi:MAG: alginate export family protein [Deltaproteobacteria bacterium]|nr:alginate export family protein [Deltaproteobacteria bacterium]